MNISGTTVSATGHKGGLGDGLYDKAGARPDLDLDFARTKSLKDRVSKEELITFTRGTSRIRSTTYVDENGLVKTAGHNLILYSHDIGNPNHWITIEGSAHGSFCTVTRNTTETTAPNGMFEATKLVMDSGTTSQRVTGVHTDNYTGTQLQANDFIIYSVYLKSATNSNYPINLSVAGSARGRFTVTPEWQRFAVRVKRAIAADFRPRIVLRNTSSNGSNQPQSDGSFVNQHAEIYAWGAQMEFDGTAGSDSNNYTGPVGELVKTTTQPSGAPRFTHDPETKESKGLLIEKQSINYIQTNTTLSSWGTARSAITIDNSITNPDGTTGAPKITADGTTGTRYVMAPAMTGPANTTKIRHSVFLKYGTHRFVDIYGNYNQWMTSSTGVRVDLLNGTAVKVGVATSLTALEEVKQFPNGWVKVTVKADMASAVTPNAQPMYLWFIADGNPGTTTGTSGISGNYFYAWGAQTEAGNDFATSTIINETTGTVTRSPDLASIEGDDFGTYRTNLVANTSFRKGSDGYFITGSNANATYESYAGISPSGNYDALKMTAIGTGTDNNGLLKLHRIMQFLTLDDASVYTVTVYLKAGTSDRAVVYLWDGDSNPLQAIINLTAETINVVGGSNGAITDVGNGWYKITVSSISTTVNGTPGVIVNVLNNAGASRYDANGESIFIWGLQVEKASAATEFIPSTDTYTNRQSNATFVDGNGIIRRSMCNQLLYSEGFDNTYWSKAQIAVTANSGIAPNGTNTAFKIEATALNTGQHYIFRNINISGAISIYAKANGYNYCSIISQRLGNTQPTEAAGVSVNLTNGNIHDIKDGTAEVIDVGDGWYRIIFSRTDNLQQVYTIFQPHDGNTTPSHANNYRVSYSGGAGTGGVLLWGAMQTDDLTEAGDYYKTTDTISGPPRYSHDPETLTPTGLYLEPAATNIATDSANLTHLVTRHAIKDTNSGIAPDGTNTAVLLKPDSTFDRHLIEKQFTTLTNSSKTMSVFVKADPNGNGRYVQVGFGITVGGIYSYTLSIFDAKTGQITDNITPVNGGGGLISKVEPYPNGWYRLTVTNANTGGGSGWSKIGLAGYPTYAAAYAANSVDTQIHGSLKFTGDAAEHSVLVWGHQVEAGIGSTSYIPTSGAEATRSADTFTSTATEVLDRANGTKPAFYTPDGTSIYAEARYNAGSHDNISNFSRILQLQKVNDSVLGIYKHGGSNHNQLQLFANNPTAAPLFAYRNYNSGSNDLQIGVRYAEDDARIYLNDNDAITNRQGSLDTDVHTEKATDLYIGNDGGSNNPTNGTIKRITFWKTPLPDSKLDKLTA